MIKSKLWQLEIEQRKKSKYDNVVGINDNISWSNQIRSYTMHPYKLVKDHRSGWETQDIDSFLKGMLLDDLMESNLQHLKSIS